MPRGPAHISFPRNVLKSGTVMHRRLVPVLGKQRQVDLCEFKATLDYIASSRLLGLNSGGWGGHLAGSLAKADLPLSDRCFPCPFLTEPIPTSVISALLPHPLARQTSPAHGCPLLRSCQCTYRFICPGFLATRTLTCLVSLLDP